MSNRIHDLQDIRAHLSDNTYKLNSVRFTCSVKLEDKQFIETFDFTQCTFDEEVNFVNCIFHGSIEFRGAIFNKSVQFENCRFFGDVSLRSIEARYAIEFKENRFYSDLLFRQSALQLNLEFVDTIFLKPQIISNSAMKLISFQNPVFFGGLTIEHEPNIETIQINGGRIKSHLRLLHLGISKELNIAGVVCKENLLINSCNTSGSFYIVYSRFKKVHLSDIKGKPGFICDLNTLRVCEEIEIANIDIDKLRSIDSIARSLEIRRTNVKTKLSLFNFKVNLFSIKDSPNFTGGIYMERMLVNNLKIIKCEFSDRIMASRLIVSKQFTIDKTVVSGMSLENSRLQSQSYISNTLFQNMVKIEKSYIYGLLEIASNTFDYSFNLIQINKHSKHPGHLIFENSTVVKRSFYHDIQFDTFSLDRSQFRLLADFRDCRCNRLSLVGVIFESVSRFEQIAVKVADRETFRIIKQQLLKSNNRIDALGFYAKEMDEYKKELYSSKIKGLIGDKVILLLSQLSNRHGLSWWRGVKFTVLVGLVFYILYLFTLEEKFFQFGWSSLNDFWKISIKNIGFYCQFIFIGHSFDFSDLFKASGLSYFVDFVSRIFIGFGYYQTIQAFRKFGKV